MADGFFEPTWMEILKVELSESEFEELSRDCCFGEPFKFTEDTARKFNKVLGFNLIRGRNDTPFVPMSNATSSREVEPDEYQQQFIKKDGKHILRIEKEVSILFQVCREEVKKGAEAVGVAIKDAQVGNKKGIDILAVTPIGQTSPQTTNEQVGLNAGDELNFRFRSCRFTRPAIVVSEEVYKSGRVKGEFAILLYDKTLKEGQMYSCLTLLQQKHGEELRTELKIQDLKDKRMGLAAMGDAQLKALCKYLHGTDNDPDIVFEVSVLPFHSAQIDFPGETAFFSEENARKLRRGFEPSRENHDMHGSLPQVDISHYFDTRRFGLNVVALLHTQSVPKVINLYPFEDDSVEHGSVYESPVTGNTVFEKGTSTLLFFIPEGSNLADWNKKISEIQESIKPLSDTLGPIGSSSPIKMEPIKMMPDIEHDPEPDPGVVNDGLDAGVERMNNMLNWAVNTRKEDQSQMQEAKLGPGHEDSPSGLLNPEAKHCWTAWKKNKVEAALLNVDKKKMRQIEEIVQRKFKGLSVDPIGCRMVQVILQIPGISLHSVLGSQTEDTKAAVMKNRNGNFVMAEVINRGSGKFLEQTVLDRLKDVAIDKCSSRVLLRLIQRYGEGKQKKKEDPERYEWRMSELKEVPNIMDKIVENAKITTDFMKNESGSIVVQNVAVHGDERHQKKVLHYVADAFVDLALDKHACHCIDTAFKTACHFEYLGAELQELAEASIKKEIEFLENGSQRYICPLERIIENGQIHRKSTGGKRRGAGIKTAQVIYDHSPKDMRPLMLEVFQGKGLDAEESTKGVTDPFEEMKPKSKQVFQELKDPSVPQQWEQHSEVQAALNELLGVLGMPKLQNTTQTTGIAPRTKAKRWPDGNPMKVDFSSGGPGAMAGSYGMGPPHWNNMSPFAPPPYGMPWNPMMPPPAYPPMIPPPLGWPPMGPPYLPPFPPDAYSQDVPQMPEEGPSAKRSPSRSNKMHKTT